MAGIRPIGRRGLALGVAGAVWVPSVAGSQYFPSTSSCPSRSHGHRTHRHRLCLDRSRRGSPNEKNALAQGV